MAQKPVSGNKRPASGPLTGIKVLDLTAVLMGPMCTQIMADLGADVIKVENPSGDTTRRLPGGKEPGMSGMFLNLNRGKRGILLDLKKPAGRAALLRLAADTDVFIHSMRSNAIARLGLDYAKLKAINPKVVYTNIYGFSRRGPRANNAAYDDTIQAISGLASLQEQLIGRPNFVSTVIADKVTAITAAYGSMAALLERERSGGIGQEVEVGMYETMVSFLMVEHSGGFLFDPPVGPPRYDRATSPHRRPYRTADGSMSVTVYTDGHFRKFAELVGDPAWADDPRFSELSVRWANLDEFYTRVEEHLGQKPTAYWLKALEAAGIPAAPVQTIEEAARDPHLLQIGYFEPMMTKEGPMRFPGIPTWFSRTPGSIRDAGPRLGEHTREVLAEAGFEEREIEAVLAETRGAA